nr:TonB-dependent receptor [Pacificimonas pallii]
MAAAQNAADAVEEQTAANAAEERDTEAVIVVTGSRIAQPTVDSAAPVQVLSNVQIEQAGVTNIQDLLLENPIFGTPGLSRTNSAFLTAGTGVATVDLRDLQTNRTLVLINGRRVVGGVANTAQVDLNVIPTQFLERVDVLTGGSSSLYGSDAVAGVVNFIFKENFEGVDANIQYGITQRGDDRRYQANLTFGANTGDGRGNIMAHIGYSNEEGLLSRERKNTRVDDFDTSRLTGNLSDWGTATEPFFSSFPPQGRFITGAGTFTFDNDGNLVQGFSTNGPNGDGVGANGFNRQAFRTLATPVERYLFAARGNYEVSDGINAFFEGTFSRTSAERLIEPFASQSAGPNGIFPLGGVVPIENFIDRDTNGDGINERVIAINPFVPDEIVAVATDQDGDGLRDFGFARRLVEFGPRFQSTDRDFYRFVIGLDGSIFDDRFNWDISYNYGQTLENQTSQGQVNVPNFQQALTAQQDFDDLDGDGDTTDAICINAQARQGGCVPINLFGVGGITDGAIAYVNADGTFDTDMTQQVVQANLSGSLVDLPAGPLGIAVGVEYRVESSSSDRDSLTNQGLNAGNAAPDTSGSFNVLEGYAELRVPLLADTPFFELLEVGGAVRVSDYSTVGTVVSYNGTVTWQPIEDLRLRGTYARAVRAPNIGELFSGPSQTFPPGINDPCQGIGLTGGGAVGDNCRAATGVLTNIMENGGTFTLNQADAQGISGFNIGNPDLQEETADSYTIGAVLTPRSINALRGLTLTVDYFNIDIDDVIQPPGRTFTLGQCYTSNVQESCDLITRRAITGPINSAGSLEFINAVQVNSARLQTDGIDVTANMAWDFDGLADGGQINARIAYTHLFAYDFTPAEGQPADPQDGEIGTAADRFTAGIGFNSDRFDIGFTGTFIAKSFEDDQYCNGFTGDCPSVGSEFNLDMQTAFRPTEEFEVYFGIDNVLDNDAPDILNGTTFNITGADTAADTYDIFGRRFYTGVRFTF